MQMKTAYNNEMEIFSKEIMKQGFDFYSDKIERRYSRSEEVEITSKVILGLQYSKEPDFLKLIDELISKSISEKKKIEIEEIEA